MLILLQFSRLFSKLFLNRFQHVEYNRLGCTVGALEFERVAVAVVSLYVVHWVFLCVTVSSVLLCGVVGQMESYNVCGHVTYKLVV